MVTWASYGPGVDVLHTLRAVLDRSVGNGGALRNCRVEQLERMGAEAEVERLRARIEVSASGPAVPEAVHRASA